MNRVRILDTLRGFAALSVAWFHVSRGFDGVLRASGEWGWLGVGVFFTVSGFVIPYAMARAGYRFADAGTFLAKRFLRLYPPYLAAVILSAGLWYASSLTPGFRGSPPSLSAADWLAHLTLSCDLTGRRWLCPVFWTLAVEAQFYLLCVFVARPLSRGRAWAPAALALLGFVPGHAHVFAFLPQFALGMAAYQAHAGVASRRAACAAAAVAFAAGWLGPLPQGREYITAAAVTAGLIAAAPAASLRPLAWLGTISYSLYLVHVPVGGRVVNLCLRLPQAWHLPGVAAALALSLLTAWLLWRFVEKPSEAAATRLKYGPRATPCPHGPAPRTPAHDRASVAAADERLPS